MTDIKTLSKGEPAWMANSRKKALEIFQNFPKREYKESPTQRDYTQDFDFSEIEIEKGSNGNLDSNVAKRYFGKAISPKENRHVAFNHAFRNSGTFIRVKKGDNLLMRLGGNVSKNNISHIVILVEKDANATFLEQFDGSDKGVYHNLIVEIFLEKNAKANYYAIQNLGKNDFGFCTRRSLGKAGSKINFVIESVGSQRYISNTKAVMEEEGAEGNVFEIFKTGGEQHMDITSDVHHKSPRTFSRLLVKGIGKDRSNSVFRGMIYMDQVASQCVSNLQHYALLLDETAKANAIPGLEIKTNDVQAKHGSAVGHIDEDHIFYLMSRGLTRDEAEQLIVDGYFEPVLSNIDDKEIREKFRVLANA